MRSRVQNSTVILRWYQQLSRTGDQINMIIYLHGMIYQRPLDSAPGSNGFYIIPAKCCGNAGLVSTPQLYVRSMTPRTGNLSLRDQFSPSATKAIVQAVLQELNRHKSWARAFHFLDRDETRPMLLADCAPRMLCGMKRGRNLIYAHGNWFRREENF